MATGTQRLEDPRPACNKEGSPMGLKETFGKFSKCTPVVTFVFPTRYAAEGRMWAKGQLLTNSPLSELVRFALKGRLERRGRNGGNDLPMLIHVSYLLEPQSAH